MILHYINKDWLIDHFFYDNKLFYELLVCLSPFRGGNIQKKESQLFPIFQKDIIQVPENIKSSLLGIFQGTDWLQNGTQSSAPAYLNSGQFSVNIKSRQHTLMEAAK